MNDFDGIDFSVGAIAWVVIDFLGMLNSSCLKSHCCGGFDMFIHDIIALGNLAPAYFVMWAFHELRR